MKVVIEIPEKMYQKIIAGTYDYGDMNVIIQNGTQYDGRPHGEWIEKHCDYGMYYRCSNCHKMPPNYECDYKEGAIKTNFCPNCGADMRQKEGESN